MLIFYFFWLFFLFEGAALLSQEKLLFLLGLTPAFYFIEKEFKKEKIIIPNNYFFIFFIFIISSVISFFTSVDKINSVSHLFLYLSAFIFFIIGFNEKENILKKINFFFITSGFFFLLFSLLVRKNPPQTPLQLIYPFYPTHNHLGDFLGLTLLILVYNYFKKRDKLNFFLFLFFFPFFLFSFSRSAYVDFFFILFLIFFQIKIKTSIIRKTAFLSLLTVFLFFIFTQRDLYRFKPFSNFLPLINQVVKFQPRELFSGRLEYFSQGIKGFWERPIFGYGLGNYYYASVKYVSKNLQQVSSALNLPLTVLTEVGIFGFLFFLLFFFLIFKNIDDKKKPYIYLFYYLFLNFLTDYTYAIYGLFLLLFLLAGMVVRKEEKINFNLYPLFSFVILFLIFLWLTAKILTLIGFPEIGSQFFSFDHETQQKLIRKIHQKGDLLEAKKQALVYEKKSFYSFEALTFLADFYLTLGEKDYVLRLYQRLTDNNKFPSLDILKRVYLLKKDIQGKKIADSYFAPFFENFKMTFWLNPQFEDEVYQFCFQENIPICRFRYFYSPKSNSQEIKKDLPIKALYKFNNDGFNERFNYLIKKPKNTFRILVLGDNNAFGFLVDTEKNWVERLEDNLNSQNSKLKANYKNFEVINLAYHSYDLAYAIERFRRDGIKYQPDLIIFMNNNFLRINEIFLPLTQKYAYLENDPTEKEKLKKEGKHFPSWQLAWEEYLKLEKCHLEIYQKQKKYLEEFFSLYRKKVIFVSFEKIPPLIKEFLENQKQVTILELTDFSQNKEYYFKEISAINQLGQQKLADLFFDFLLLNH